MVTACSGIVPRDAYILTPSKCWFNPSVAEIMAYHHFSLSSLKVTQRPVFGGKSVQFIHQSTLDGVRGCMCDKVVAMSQKTPMRRVSQQTQ